MLENYLISITGKQNIDGETDEVNLTTLGTFVQKGEKNYIAYKEYNEGGMTGRTAVLKIEPGGKVTIMHTGADTHLILEEGIRHLCQYDMGISSMMVGVFASKVESDFDEKGGKLHVNYTLDINSSLSSQNEIFVSVKEAEDQHVQINPDCKG